MRSVYITNLSKYLPNEPVGNDEIEQVLGMVNNKPSRARSIVLRNNGIKTRYYAFRNGKSTHTNAELGANAVSALFDEKHPAAKLELLAVGSSSPDQLLPNHASMIHGLIGDHPIELNSASGSCCSSMQALKYAYMSVLSGGADMAAVCGSEKVSTWMHSSRFQQEADALSKLEDNPIIAFEKDFLRWMLSDGAGAALLESKPNDEGISLKIEWVELTSYANEFDTCMYSGAVKNEDGTMTGWSELEMNEWGNQSAFSFKQDTRLLGENIVPKGGDYLEGLAKKHNIGSDDVNYYLPHMSSEFFKNQIFEYQKKIGMELSWDKWFYNLPKVGNVGSASAFLMLEELFFSGRLKKGEHLLVMVPESARFTYAYLYLTVV